MHAFLEWQCRRSRLVPQWGLRVGNSNFSKPFPTSLIDCSRLLSHSCPILAFFSLHLSLRLRMLLMLGGYVRQVQLMTI